MQQDDAELVRLLEISRAFKASKALNLAGKLGIFTLCAQASEGLTCQELCSQLGFCGDPGFRGAQDFLDLLVSIKTLTRSGSGPEARYWPHPANQQFLVDGSPSCVTGILALNNDRSIPLFGHLEEALRTGELGPQVRALVPDISETFATSAPGGKGGLPGGAEHFALGMLGASLGNFRLLARTWDGWSKYKTLVDIGGSTGCLCVAVCQAHPHITAVTCDLPAVHSTAVSYVEQHKLQDRVEVLDLDMFDERQQWPKADVIAMGMVLHDWGPAKKDQLIRRAFAALNPGGALMAIDCLIDDERRTATTALGMSLNMLVEFGKENAGDYTLVDFQEWAKNAGFARAECLPLLGPTKAAIAYKSTA